MNKTKLEVFRLDNEDVIATSCKSYNLGIIIYDNPEFKHIVLQNNTGSELKNLSDLPNPLTSASYDNKSYYHADSNGNFIEWCPGAGQNHFDEEGAYNAHNIERDKD